MKNLNILLISLSILFVLPAYSQAPVSNKSEALVWFTDVKLADAASKSSNKPIFAFFTGSDWCGWCKKMQRDVFAKAEFIDWAKNNVVLLELDFPRKTQLSPELTEQNRGLQQAFQVQGYPTIWFFTLKNDGSNNFQIDALGSMGYPSGAEQGKEEVKFLEEANGILKSKSGK